MCLNLLHMRDAEDPRIVENLAQRPEAGKVGLGEPDFVKLR